MLHSQYSNQNKFVVAVQELKNLKIALQGCIFANLKKVKTPEKSTYFFTFNNLLYPIFSLLIKSSFFYCCFLEPIIPIIAS